MPIYVCRCLVTVRAILDLLAESVTLAETASMIRLAVARVRLKRTVSVRCILKNGFSLQLHDG